MNIIKIITICIIAICILGCEQKPKQELQGYVEGELIYVASPYGGTLQKLYARRGNFVKTGSALFSLDPEPESSQLEAAESRVDQEKAILKDVKKGKNYSPTAPRSEAAQNAAVKVAEASVEQLRWSVNQKHPTAKIDAMVFDTYFREGELVPPTAPVVSLLAAKNIVVTFFIPEYLLNRIHVGNYVTVACDGCVRNYKAQVSYIAANVEFMPPLVFSRDTNSKYIFRAKATLAANEAFQLHPGQPVYVIYGK